MLKVPPSDVLEVSFNTYPHRIQYLFVKAVF